MNVEMKMKAQNIVGYLLALIGFFLPLKAQVSTIFIILSLVISLPFADWKNFFPSLIRNKFFLLSIAYFFMHVIGILYSTNTDYAMKDVELKLSFLVFPVLFTAFQPSPKQVDFIKGSFIAGCITALIICLVKAIIAYRTNHQIDELFYTKFSRMMHPTYFSFYLNVALLFLIDAAYKNSNSKSIIFKVEFFCIELFLLTGIFLLSARMALMTCAFTLIIFVILKSIQLKEKRKFTLMLLISFLIAGFIQFELNSLYNRFTQIENTIVNEKQITNDIAKNQAKPEEYNSTTSRIALWKYSTELITRSPQNILFGVGTGDIKDELMSVYVKHHFQKGIDEHYNPHNQFLHTTVSLGLIGLSLLVLILFSPLISFLKQKQFVPMLFLIIIILNALTESILEVQSGIIFFCFFYCLLQNNFERSNQSNLNIEK